jgi:hypothetical protein
VRCEKKGKGSGPLVLPLQPYVLVLDQKPDLEVVLQAGSLADLGDLDPERS